MSKIGWEGIRNPILKPVQPRVEEPQWVNLPRTNEPRKIFDCMWNEGIFRYLCSETNRQNSDEKFDHVTLDEMCRFFGQHIVLAALQLPVARDLWTTTPFEISYLGKECGLSRDRWEVINSHVTFNPSSLRDKLVTSFQHYIIPGTFLTCDESRIRAHHKDANEVDYNPTKPERWAVQSYSFNLSNHYLYDFTVPKEMTAFQALRKFANTASTSGRVHHITADSHFSNGTQAEALLLKDIHFTLCCKTDAAPSGLFNKGLAEGLPKWKSRFAKKGKLVAACLHRKKKVCLISSWYTIKNAEKSGAADRRVIIDHYDNTKRETDQFNHLVGNYHTHNKHRNVKTNMLLGWFEWALTNAYVLYVNCVKQPVDHRAFLFAVSESLLKFPWK